MPPSADVSVLAAYVGDLARDGRAGQGWRFQKSAGSAGRICRCGFARTAREGELGREAQGKLELIWSSDRLVPYFKAIADFRKDNGKAITVVCNCFAWLCQTKVSSHAVVAIDGTHRRRVLHSLDP